MVCICTTLLLAIPFTSLAVSPKSFVPEYQKIAPTPNGDPDGAYAGGLDDPTDWENFFWGVAKIGFLGVAVVRLLFPDFETLRGTMRFMLAIFGVGFNSITGLRSFAEAFDLKDIDNDGQ